MGRRRSKQDAPPAFVSAYKDKASAPQAPKKVKSPSLIKKLWRGLWQLIKWGVFAFVLLQAWFLAHILWWKTNPPPSTAFMRERVDETPGLHIHYHWIPYTQISSSLKRALIASEDANFLWHHGFDWEGIRLAYLKNERRGHITSGGSTITQQLAKNLFLNSNRNFVRKAQEAIITVMLEECWSKTRILEVYANVIEFGNGIFGAEAAADHYFGIPANELTTWQSARLAAMVPRPRYYEKHQNSNYLQHRSATIHARLASAFIP